MEISQLTGNIINKTHSPENIKIDSYWESAKGEIIKIVEYISLKGILNKGIVKYQWIDNNKTITKERELDSFLVRHYQIIELKSEPF